MVAHPFVRSKALFVPLFLWYNEVILSTGGVFLTTLYVTDLDGTLLNAQGRVSSSTAALLRPLVDRGLALTIATARTPATALDLVRPLGLHLPAVMMSGALVYDLGTGRPLATRSLSAESRSALLALLDRAGRDALVYCVLDGRLVVFHRAPTCDYARSFIAQRSSSPHKQFVQVEHYGQIPLAARCLLTLFCLPCPDRPLLEALQRLPGTHCLCYADEYGRGVTAEVFPEGCDKGAGVQDLRRLTGARRVVAFGDNVNDLPLFAAADERYAVANAAAAVKEAADGVIGANTQDGVACWLAAREGGSL